MRKCARLMPHLTMSAAVLAALVGLNACGGNSSNGAGAASKLSKNTSGTMPEWNWDTVADEPAEHAALPIAIRAFKREYPHVNVTDTEMTLSEQTDKLPLAFANSSSAPVVSQTNEGFSSMGRLVTDGELIPLDSYAKKYGWLSKVGQAPLQNNSFTSDGKNYGSGNIYGVPETADVMGVFYNKKMLSEVGGTIPTSWTVFTHYLALLHQAGKIPMAYSGGQPTDYQPVNVFNVIANQFVPASQGIAWVYHKGSNPTINTPGYVQAATTLQQWGRSGYLSPGYQGLSSAAALSQFTSGKTGFMIEGDWYISTVKQGLGNDAGFWVPKVATGGPGEGWSIPTHSANPALAAAWINLLLSPTIQGALLQHGDIPIVKPNSAALVKSSPMLQTAAKGWNQAVATNSMVPFLADAPPASFLNNQQAGIQELLAGKTTPQALMKSWQSGYATYWSGH